MVYTFRHASLAVCLLLGAVAAAQPTGTPVPLAEDALASALLTPVTPASTSLQPRSGVRGAAAQARGVTVTLPQPDGTPGDYVLTPSRVLAPALQAAHPDIRTFSGFRQNAPHTAVRVTYAPSAGWHVSYDDPAAPRAVVRAAAPGDYRLVRPADAPAPTLACGVTGEALRSAPGDGKPHARGRAPSPDKHAAPSRAKPTTRPLRTYRLALTCTGEYARAIGGADVTVAEVLAAYATGVNRLNEVFERDLAISFELVPETERLIFLDPRADPYTNGDAGAMIDESQATITRLIGAGAYDVGHLYGTDGSGLAQLGAVCDDDVKAAGITGISNVTGDAFYIDYVAHELGHQFGATHTFYNACGGARTTATGFEPGSGTTIMAYAGICSPNVQSRSDDYFHAISLEQINGFVEGAGCGTAEATANGAPVFDDGDAPVTYYVPAGNAFELRAPATDPDGDRVRYTFEQFDGGGAAAQPPRGTNAVGPLYRSDNPDTLPYRRFGDGAGGRYDVRATVARQINVRATARDYGRPAGQTAARDFVVEVVDAEPLLITNAAAAAAAEGFSAFELAWDVGGSAALPVGAEVVDVLFSPDGGATWTDTLAADVPNAGTYVVTVPNVATDRGRFVVRDPRGAFYDVSRGDLTVEPATAPTFTLSASASALSACAGPLDAGVRLEATPRLGFAEPIAFAVEGVPPVLTAELVAVSGSGDLAQALTLSSGGQDVPAGEYALTVVATGGDVERRLALAVVVGAAPATAVAEEEPVDGERFIRPTVEFALTEADDAGGYRLQVATDPGFAAPLLDETSAYLDPVAGRNRRRVDGLAPGVYFYRVAFVNDCGAGPWGASGAFEILSTCEVAYRSTAPVAIGDGPANTVTSSVEVFAGAGAEAVALEVFVDVRHTWVGDLSARLTYPNGVTRDLFARPGGGNCSGSDIVATFSADASFAPADFAAACDATAPAIAGRFRPAQSFPSAVLASPNGAYTLTLRDNAGDDGGELIAWGVRLTKLTSDPPAVALAPETLSYAADSASQSVPLAALGLANPEDVPLAELTAVIKPGVYADPGSGSGGFLDEGGDRLPPGTVVTLADFPLAVSHSSPNAAVGATDTLVFDVFGPDGLCLPGQRLPIRTDLISGVRPGGGLAVDARLYPNPARGVVTVEVVGAGAVRDVRLRDVTGRVVQVLAQAPADNAVRADLSALPPGYYFVEVDAEGGRASLPLVVQ